MPDRNDQEFLQDILEETDLLAKTLASMSVAEFSSDPVLQRAVLHMLQVIGEASGRLSEETRSVIPDVPWPLIRGLRNRIVHGYFGLDIMAVWLTATTEAPRLAASIRASKPV